MALDYTMVTTYGTFAKDDRQLSAWGNAVNLNLDDKISKTNTAIQAIASQINQNGLLNMGANIDLNANDLIVASGGDKTITAADLAFLVGLNQFLTKTSPAEFSTLKIGTLAGVLKASGGNVSGAADTDDLPVGTTNKYYTTALHNVDFDARLLTKFTDDLAESVTDPDRRYYTDERVDDEVNSLLQDGTEVRWVYDDAGNRLTPMIDNNTIATARLVNGTNAQIIIAGGTGAWAARTMSGDGTINGTGALTVVNDSHTHSTQYYLQSQVDNFLNHGSSDTDKIACILDNADVFDDSEAVRAYLDLSANGVMTTRRNTAGGTREWYFHVPLPSHRGGKSLVIKEILVMVYSTGVSGILDEIALYEERPDNIGRDQIWSDPADKGQGPVTYSPNKTARADWHGFIIRINATVINSSGSFITLCNPYVTYYYV